MDPTFLAPRGVGGTHTPPPDKSVTHRALMLAGISNARSRIRNALSTGDCISTRRCLQSLGVEFVDTADGIEVKGVGLRGFAEPGRTLDAENSGTTTRLLSGLLAGQRIFAVLTGDESLVRRPMGRVVDPLRQMGAHIEGREAGRFAPLCFIPGTGDLRPLSWDLPVPSAQVKSSLLLAALRAGGPSRIGGKTGSRDHTERMLRSLGVRLEGEGATLVVHPPAQGLPGFDADVPGDVSSAAFFVTAALITGRDLEIHGCGINPTRCGFIEVARRMGAAADIAEERTSLGEPVGSITLRPGRALQATDVLPEEVPGLIDEIPLIAVLGLFARGRTEVRGAAELRVKESDRLVMIARMAESLGGRLEIFEDGFAVDGPQQLRPGVVDPQGDHRIAMAAAVAGAAITGGVRVTGFDCSRVSYPDFIRDFTSLGGEVA
jgi:3-phosphoshikimate 1-carboxyvinyltransferase